MNSTHSTAPLFGLGQVVMTPGAIDLLDRLRCPASNLIARHQGGDWGDLSSEDRQANESSVKNGDRILSAYMIGSEKVWVITEADRSSTCILMPEEY